MAKQNSKKDTVTAEKDIYPTKEYTRNYLLCRLNIFKTKPTQSTQKTMSRTNTHRKNRNSRENYSKLGETFNISTIAFIYPKFSSFSSPSKSSSTLLSSALFRPSHFGHSFWQCAMVISMLVLLSSTKVISALTQRSHLTVPTMTTIKSTTPMALAATKTSTATATMALKYSQPFTEEENNNDSFRPIIPKDINQEIISQNMFTRTGQYHVFEPVNSDLGATFVMKRMVPFPVENLKNFNDKSDVVTLQSKRKTTLERKHVVTNREGNNKQQEDQKVPERTKDIFIQTKLNQSAPKRQNIQQPHVERTEDRQHIVASSKQLSPNALRSTTPKNATSIQGAHNTQDGLATEIKGLENLLSEYVDNFFNKGQYQPKPELIFALQQNYTDMSKKYEQRMKKYIPDVEKNRSIRQVFEKRNDGAINLNIPRTLESGRLLFFAGLKKVMWPIYMGLQVLKSLMLALLLPTLIGSFGKLLGKGISSGSAPLFIRPMDEPQDLDFRDNNFNFDDDSTKFASIDDANAGGNVKDGGYAYNQAEASQTHNQYAYNAASINQQALSRYGMNERQQLMQDSYLSALQSLGAASFKNSNGFSGSSSGGGGGGGGLAGLVSPMRQKPASPANMNTFQQFQKVPASSLLLSNYDPFYSPLLSRLDSVFAQLKLKSDDESCREKLICLMYANPAKYAPYSNLVSAQLSRELNELRKPTSDNPDILRFFKYMRAAKDGQDGVDCEISFDKCKEFKDFESPAMVSTYHDINKLVQARKLTLKSFK